MDIIIYDEIFCPNFIFDVMECGRSNAMLAYSMCMTRMHPSTCNILGSINYLTDASSSIFGVCRCTVEGSKLMMPTLALFV